MSNKHIQANKKRWAKIPKEKRSVIMTKVIEKRYENITPIQRKKIGKMLTNARKAKRV